MFLFVVRAVKVMLLQERRHPPRRFGRGEAECAPDIREKRSQPAVASQPLEHLKKNKKKKVAGQHLERLKKKSKIKNEK
jgi:hypothetical protein